MASTPSPLMQEMVRNLSFGGCYGIEWELQEGRLRQKAIYNPPGRAERDMKQGTDGLYTTLFATHDFAPGSGLVGDAFKNQAVIFAKYLEDGSPEGIIDAMSCQDSSELQRSGLARKFGIRSAVFVPLPTGVIEVGSTSCGRVMPNFHSDAVRVVVEANAGRPVYCVEWVQAEGEIHATGHYDPNWFAKEREGHSLAPAEGLYSLRFPLLPPPSGVDTPMARVMRTGLAEIIDGSSQHGVGIRGSAYPTCPLVPEGQGVVVFVPLPANGGPCHHVLEVGTAPSRAGLGSGGQCLPNVGSTTLFATCSLLQAPIGLEWRLQPPGVELEGGLGGKEGDQRRLVVVGHYNSPEMVRKCQANFEGRRYTHESHSYSFAPGEAMVGGVFKSGKSVLVPDLLALPREAFKRSELAAHFNIRTAVFIASRDSQGAIDGVLEICTDRVCAMFKKEIAAAAGTIPDGILAELKELSMPVWQDIY